MQLKRQTEAGRRDDNTAPAARIQTLIRRKLSEKRRLEQEIAELQEQMAPFAAVVEQLRGIAGEIHALFREALRHPGLSRRDRQQIEALYRGLEEDLLGPDPAVETDPSEVPCDCEVCRAEADDEADPFGGPAGDRSREPVAGATPGTQRDPSLRNLYHALALRFHPDRAGDDDARARHNERMREINAAFHGGDTDRLLELSRELGIDTGALRDADGVVAELVAQYERVKAEVRELRDSPPGQLLIDTRRARRDGDPTPLESLEAEMQDHLLAMNDTREHLALFVAGKLTVRELLAGPDVGDDDDGDDDELFLSLLDLMNGAVDRQPGPAAGQKRRRKRR